MRFVELATASEHVTATTKRGEKTSLLAALLRSMTPDEAAVAVGLLTGQPRQGRIGVGWSALSKLDVADAEEPSLEVLEIDRWLSALAAESGPGSTARRRDLLADVFARATAPEQRLLWGVFSGELRQGALDGVMVDAIARGAGVPIEEVRRAHMFSGDLGETARQAFVGGVDALRTVSRSCRGGRSARCWPRRRRESPRRSPRRAWRRSSGSSTGPGCRRTAAPARSGCSRATSTTSPTVCLASCHSLPGCRVAISSSTARSPELTEDGGPRRFQDTMGDFSAQAAAGRGGGLAAYFFDVMHAGGAALVDEPLAARRVVLDELVPAPFRLPSIVTADADEAAVFMDDAVGRGLEGVMVKDLDVAVRGRAAGRRVAQGQAGAHVRPGGSRRGVGPWPAPGLVVQPPPRRSWRRRVRHGRQDVQGDDRRVAALADRGAAEDRHRHRTRRIAHVVHVRPEKVVEVAIDGVQRSPRYPGGVALRFARVRRYRPDKTAADADRIESLQALL